jgi:hypothetical protein
MKTLVKIVIGLVLVTGAFNASRAAMNNYQFEDAVREGILFDPRSSDAEILAMVAKLANEYDVPLAPEDIEIRDVSSEVRINMTYTRQVVLLPGIYTRDWTFTPSASTRILTGSRRH